MISTISISTIIRITLLVLLVLALLDVAGAFDPWLAMRPDQIWPGLQLWRLLTWPIALNFGGLLIGSIAFSQPGEEIETMLGKTRFGLVLLGVTLIVAALHLLCFWKSSTAWLAGAENISLFVMVGYVYLFPESSVRVLFFNVRSKILLLLMSLFPIGATILAVIGGESVLVLFGVGGGGLILGTLWFHLVYQKYPVLLGPVRFVMQMGKKPPQKTVPSRPQMVSRKKSNPPEEGKVRLVSDEERLDSILEQISKNGYESLSGDDRKFLDEYSSRL